MHRLDDLTNSQHMTVGPPLPSSCADTGIIAVREMNWDNVNPYEYHPERGLYYHEIVPNLLCGSQPRSAYDIDLLRHKVGATDIVSLQQVTLALH